VFYLATTGMHGGLVAFATEFFVLHFTRNRLLVDSGLVILHLAFLARKKNVGVFSAWHVKNC